MKARARKRARTTPAPRSRSANSRQRQVLIEACISALHLYGPSGTTVERVVAIAEMSPGIVRFYFDSKAALLVAALEALAAEFEERVLAPVDALKSTPVAALDTLVDLYFDPDIASARKVTVWYAYWGEASSRQEYYDICGQKDESFAALVRDLVGRMIEHTGARHLDADGMALGLSGALEILWQDIAFQDESAIDRVAAKRRCRAYLASIFPGLFARETLWTAASARLAKWSYHSEAAFEAERDALFHDSWCCIGHESQLPDAGDFVAVETVAERVLLVRDAAGGLRAFRNNCPARPHRLIDLPRGHLLELRCATHGLRFGLDGCPRPARADGLTAPAALTAMVLVVVAGLILVRTSPPMLGDGASVVDVLAGAMSADLHLLGVSESCVAADWKGVIEQWLDSAGALPHYPWTERCYGALCGGGAAQAGASAAHASWQRRFIAPNHWLQVRPDGITYCEALPLGAARSVVRRFELTRCESPATARALAYLGSRAPPLNRASSLAAAESLQAGRSRFGYAEPEAAGVASLSFRRLLLERVPLLRLPRAPAVE